MLKMWIVILVSVMATLGCLAQPAGTLRYPHSGYEAVSLPAPEAATLAHHLDHSYNYSTGNVEISIPLFTLKGNGIELPIGLQYHTGGVSPSDEDSEVGVGWGLDCGGMVTRVIRGVPDGQASLAPYGASLRLVRV